MNCMYVIVEGFVPYPAYEYYLNDIWKYDLKTKRWVEVIYNDGDAAPTGRCDMIMLMTRSNILFMHGGFKKLHI